MRQIPFGKPILGPPEREAVQKVLSGTTLVHGPLAKDFEKKFAQWTNSPFAISTSSCTASLHLAYFYLGIRPGDEVIVPAQTHVATAHAVELMGGKPVFVDSELETGNIDITAIESAITPRTRALSLVHYLGMPVDMPRLMTIAKKHNLFVVEDCALAIGTKIDGIHAGLWGDLGCYSFYPVKHMTTAEGGMLTTKHAEIATRIERQKAFGVDRTVAERKVPGVYDVTMLGFNYRMNELEAALGIAQVDRLNDFLKIRQQNFNALQTALQELDEIRLFKSSDSRLQSSYYCLSILLSDRLSSNRLEIVNELTSRGIGSSVYYPEAVPHFTYYREKYGYTLSEFPAARRISHTSIALPVGPHLDLEDMDTISKQLKEIIWKVKAK